MFSCVNSFVKAGTKNGGLPKKKEQKVLVYLISYSNVGYEKSEVLETQ